MGLVLGAVLSHILSCPVLDCIILSCLIPSSPDSCPLQCLSPSLSQSAAAVQRAMSLHNATLPIIYGIPSKHAIISSQLQHGLHCSINTPHRTVTPDLRLSIPSTLSSHWMCPHPGMRHGHGLYSLRQKASTSRSQCGVVYLYFFDVWGGDVAGFPRAAAGPQPPVFVAPLQD